MTNLFLETAAKKGYYTLENLPTGVLNNNWFKERLEWYTKQYNDYKLPESLNFDYVGKFMKLETDQPDLVHMERIVILAFDGVNIRSLNNYKGKYTMYPLHEDTWLYRQHLDNRDLPKIDSPNGIGVFTTKKLKDWFVYCDACVNALKEMSNTNQSKEAANRLVITNFIESVTKIQPTAKVWNWSNEYRVETNHFDICFKLHDKGTYLCTDIKYKGTLDDIIKTLSV